MYFYVNSRDLHVKNMYRIITTQELSSQDFQCHGKSVGVNYIQYSVPKQRKPETHRHQGETIQL